MCEVALVLCILKESRQKSWIKIEKKISPVSPGVLFILDNSAAQHMIEYEYDC